ncbi:MAG: hypothetical protein NTV63_03325 [Candidatus Woesearchaeota archaeon]|nr:hypothetical protein [Candidatus Woesearchaeota archaeon]
MKNRILFIALILVVLGIVSVNSVLALQATPNTPSINGFTNSQGPLISVIITNSTNNKNEYVNASSIKLNYSLNSGSEVSLSISYTGNTTSQSYEVNATMLNVISDGDQVRIFMDAKNDTGESMNRYNWTFTGDQLNPSATLFVINDSNKNVTNTTPIELNITASDSRSGISTVVVNSSTSGGKIMSNFSGTLFRNVTTPAALGCAADAACVLTVTVTDIAGNTNNSVSMTLLVDSIAPLVGNITSNDADKNVTPSQSLYINLTSSDSSSGIASVVINGGSAVTMTLSGSVYQVTTTATALGCGNDGNCVLTVTGTDVAGNANSTETYTITVDNTAPSVGTIFINDTDKNLSSLTAPIEINVTVNDSGSNVSTVRVNSVGMTFVSSANLYRAATTATALGCSNDATCTLTVNATDTLGYENTAVTTTIYVDTSKPVVTNIAGNDTDRNVTPSQPLEINVSVTDVGSNVSSVKVNGGGDVSMTLVGGTNIYRAATTASALGCGNDAACVLTVTAADAVGNANNSETYTIYVDNLAPLVGSITSNDADKNVTPSQSLYINLTSSDSGSGISSVVINSTLGGKPMSLSGSVYQVTTTASALGCSNDADCVLNVTATDNVGNSNTTQYYTVTIDNTPPNVTGIVSNDSNTNVTPSQPIELNVTVIDATSGIASVVINSSAGGKPMSVVSGSLYRVATTASALGCSNDATCTLTVTAIDNVVNSNATEQYNLYVDNTVPTVTIITPASGGYALSDSPMVAVNITDSGSNVSKSSIRMYWRRNQLGWNIGTLVNSSISYGYQVNLTNIPVMSDSDNITIKVNVSDNAGNAVTDYSWIFTIDLNYPAILFQGQTPADGSRQISNSVTFNVSVSDTNGISACKLEWNASGSAVNETMTLSGNDCYITNATIDGKNYSFRMFVNDSAGRINYTAARTFLENTKPSITGVEINETAVYFNTSINCSYNWSDADGDSVTATFKWFNGSSQISGETSVILTEGKYKHFDVLRCEVIPSDGNEFGTAVNSSSVTALNYAPAVPSQINITPATAYKNNTLTCAASGSTDADNDTRTYYYKFLDDDNSTVLQAWGTTATFDCNANALCTKGNSIMCIALAYDGTVNSTTYKNTTVVIQNSVPSTTAPALSPSPAYKTTGVINCTNASFTDNDPADTATWLYNWYKNNTLLPNITNYLTNGSFVKTDVLVCQITPNDGAVNGTSVNSTALTISNTAPTTPTDLVADNNKKVGETITAACTDSYDADSDSITYYYEFYNLNGANTTQAYSTTTTYTVLASDAHDQLRVRCKANDSTDVSAEDEVNVDIANTAPEVPSAVNIVPTTAYKNDTLNCTASGSTDADVDSITYYYKFLDNDNSTVLQNWSTTATFDCNANSDCVKTDTIYCRAQAYDGAANSSSFIETTRSISNSVPSTTAPTLSPLSAYKTTGIINCTNASFTDNDPADTATWLYNWYKNGTLLLANTTNYLTNNSFNKNENITCQITPNDGSVNGTSVNSTSLTISNSVPTAPTLGASNPSSASRQTSNSVTLNCTGSYDADGDTIYYEFYGNSSATAVTPNALLQNLTSDSYAWTTTDGNTYYWRCRANDAAGGDSSYTLISNFSENQPPIVASATIAPTIAYANDTLTCANGTITDAEGDTVTVLYAWYNQSGVIPGANSATLAGRFLHFDNITCGIKANDTYQLSNETNSTKLAILNFVPTPPTMTTNLTLRETNHTPNVNWTKGTDPVDGDTITTIVYVGTTASPTAQEGNNTGTGLAIGSTVTLSDGTTYYVKLISWDGYNLSSSYTADDDFQMNALPSTTTPTISPSTAYAFNNLTCTFNVTDAQADTLSVTWKWWNGTSVNSTSTLSVTNNTPTTIALGANIARKAENWTCEITPYDGYENGTSRNATAVTIVNTVMQINSTLPLGTVTNSTPDLLIVTSEYATCKYDTSFKSYSFMSSTMTASGNAMQHTGDLGTLSDSIYNYWVACSDTAGTIKEFTIGFILDTDANFNYTQWLTPIWDTLWIPPQTVLENMSYSNFTITAMLNSISSNYSQAFYYNGSAWIGYNKALQWDLNALRYVNNTNDKPYWLKLNVSTKDIRYQI